MVIRQHGLRIKLKIGSRLYVSMVPCQKVARCLEMVYRYVCHITVFVGLYKGEGVSECWVSTQVCGSNITCTNNIVSQCQAA